MFEMHKIEMIVYVCMYGLSVGKDRTDVEKCKENPQRQTHGYTHEPKLKQNPMNWGILQISGIQGLSKTPPWGQAKGTWGIVIGNPTYILDEDSIKV